MIHTTRQIITRTIPGTAITAAPTTTASNPLLTLQVETGHQDCGPRNPILALWTFCEPAPPAQRHAVIIS